MEYQVTETRSMLIQPNRSSFFCSFYSRKILFHNSISYSNLTTFYFFNFFFKWLDFYCALLLSGNASFSVKLINFFFYFYILCLISHSFLINNNGLFIIVTGSNYLTREQLEDETRRLLILFARRLVTSDYMINRWKLILNWKFVIFYSLFGDCFCCALSGGVYSTFWIF